MSFCMHAAQQCAGAKLKHTCKYYLIMQFA